MEIICKRVISIVLVMISILALGGCGYTKEEKAEMEELKRTAEKNAKEYVKEKYGFDAKVVESKCDTVESMDFSPAPTGDVFVQMKYQKEKFWVFIDGEDKTRDGYDNYQAAQILEDFKQKIEDVLGKNLKSVNLAYGKYAATEKNSMKYGLTKDKYDGKNLSDVLGKSGNNRAVISYVEKDTFAINEDEICEQFGNNAYYLFVDYRNENAYNNMTNYTFNLSGKPIEFQIENFAIFIKDYAVIKETKKDTVVFDLKKSGDIYYVLEEGTYCNFEKTSLNDVTYWNGNGFKNAKQIYEAYSVETDADKINIWVSKDAVKDTGVKNMCFVKQYYKNGETVYKNVPTTDTVGKSQYLYMELDTGNITGLKFSIFTDEK